MASFTGRIGIIEGTVNSRHEILFQIAIRDSRGNEHQIEVILESGFNGSLTLPFATISQLDLPWLSQTSATLADGNVGQFDVHAATVIWDGTPRSITVEAIDGAPLLGMALLVGSDLQVRVVDGGN